MLLTEIGDACTKNAAYYARISPDNMTICMTIFMSKLSGPNPSQFFMCSRSRLLCQARRLICPKKAYLDENREVGLRAVKDIILIVLIASQGNQS